MDEERRNFARHKTKKRLELTGLANSSAYVPSNIDQLQLWQNARAVAGWIRKHSIKTESEFNKWRWTRKKRVCHLGYLALLFWNQTSTLLIMYDTKHKTNIWSKTGWKEQ
jgi:hypothetical protein